MFLKAVLTFLAVGALSVNASSVPVAQSPAPEPQSEGGHLKASWMFNAPDEIAKEDRERRKAAYKAREKASMDRLNRGRG